MDSKINFKDLGTWYQRVNIDGEYTTPEKLISGEEIWPFIRSCLPEDIEGMRFLDIGANACYYSLMLALEGAEVLAIEPDRIFHEQALFLKSYYEKLYKETLPVTIEKTSISDIELSEIGEFDCVLLLSVMNFIGRHLGGKYCEAALKEKIRVIKELTNITNKIIIRTRNNRPEITVKYYNRLFMDFDFYMLKKIVMKRPIVSYGRLIREEEEDYEW